MFDRNNHLVNYVNEIAASTLAINHRERHALLNVAKERLKERKREGKVKVKERKRFGTLNSSNALQSIVIHETRRKGLMTEERNGTRSSRTKEDMLRSDRMLFLSRK